MQCQVKSNVPWDPCILIVFECKYVFFVNGKNTNTFRYVFKLELFRWKEKILFNNLHACFGDMTKCVFFFKKYVGQM